MEPMIETNMAFTFIFLLAVAWFFLRKFSQNPFDKTLKRAMAGNAQAQYDMGHFYYQGKKVARNFTQAFNWFDTAAKQGHVRALVAVAGLYNEGKGCAKNPQKAFECYDMAAKTGDFEARVNLAVCYLQGNGTEKDEK
ncbi:MAG: sel1 repeat family protein, partial [Elusimicrobiaceae bacterium]|nr:sel1 repeat family protein [Elusimicrobiaceae bacterium]